jgi:hypothetical protein
MRHGLSLPYDLAYSPQKAGAGGCRLQPTDERTLDFLR